MRNNIIKLGGPIGQNIIDPEAVKRINAMPYTWGNKPLLSVCAEQLRQAKAERA